MRRLLFTFSVVVAVSVMFGLEAQPIDLARFHHIHLNTTDSERSRHFYRTVFGAQPVRFGDRTDALFTGRGFILLNEVPAVEKDLERTVVRHIGWAGIDGPSEYEWWISQGLEVHTPLTQLGENWFFYFWGPDREIVEVYTGDKNHWFNHIHLWAEDVSASSEWFERHLGQVFARGARRSRPQETGSRWSNAFRIDGVSFVFIYKDHYYADSEPRLTVGRTLESSQGSPVDHVAFSYEDIHPVFDRLQASGVEIIQPITYRPQFGFRSFFINGPDGLLVEIVEAKPIPESLWR